ncbi:hypothetical protein AB0D37_35480 [Streptomyces sp. NPDC048384]|uniref:hypothetical protein n=1 Tax=Streptomyces sp. NPDC048384 TaxID=3155487 RepID=UPI0034249D31
MAAYSPHAGLDASLIFGGVIGLFYEYKLVRIGRTPGEAISAMIPRKSTASGRKKEFEEWQRDREQGTYHYPPHFAILHAFVIFAAVSCVSFAVLNAVLNATSLPWGQMWKELRNQWASGILVLRASTVWFCGVVVGRQAYHYLRSGFPGSWRAEKAPEFQEFETIPAFIGEANRRLRDFSQSAIFVFSLSALWLVYAGGVKSPAIAIISWAFVFFCDDWQIIAEYSREIKGRMLFWHRRRVDAANAILVSSISYLIVERMDGPSVVWFMTIIPILLFRYIGLHESEGKG